MKIRLLTLMLLATLAFSCRTPRENIYFGDTTNLDATEIEIQEFIKIKPGDKLTVLVSTGNETLDELLNATYGSYSVGGYARIYPQAQNVSLYTVNSEGNINLPVIGELHVSGLNRDEVGYLVEKKLRDEGYAQNPVVVVELEKMTITMIGEVKHPGRYTLPRDGVTIIEAIGTAGDITDNGNRNTIKVIRDEDGKKRSYVLDFNSAESTMGSPAYYLQQNDIIYVEPNEKRIRQSVAGGNDIYTTTFWIKLSSLLTSIASLIINW